jgi:predicted PurR-regulated permease PerM
MDTRWRTLFLLVVAGLVVGVGYQARAVVTPLLAALLLAYVLDPVVRVLQRRGLSRMAASGLVVVVSLATLLAVTIVGVQRAVEEGGALYERVTGDRSAQVESPAEALIELSESATAAAAVARAERLVRTGFYPDRSGFYLDLNEDGEQQPAEPVAYGDDRDLAVAQLAAANAGGDVARTWAVLHRAEWRGSPIWYVDEDGDGTFDPGYARRGVKRVQELLKKYDLHHQFQEALDNAAELGPQVASTAGDVLARVVEGGRSAVSTALGLLTLLLLFPIYLYFALVNLSKVYDVGVAHLPADTRPVVVPLLHKIHVTLSAFFRGRLLVLFLKWIMLMVAFLGFGVPFSFVCASFAALAALVPVIGGPAGAVPPLLLALSSGASLGSMLGLAAVLILIEVIEGYVLIPGMIGKQVGLHPLTVLVSTFVAGDLLGLFGMLIAIPLAAVVKILFGELVLPEVRRRAGIAEEAAEGAGPAPPDPSGDADAGAES